jgi:hypothetical protein
MSHDKTLCVHLLVISVFVPHVCLLFDLNIVHLLQYAWRLVLLHATCVVLHLIPQFNKQCNTIQPKNSNTMTSRLLKIRHIYIFLKTTNIVRYGSSYD